MISFGDQRPSQKINTFFFKSGAYFKAAIASVFLNVMDLKVYVPKNYKNAL